MPDDHLDDADQASYIRALKRAVEDGPDWHLDLGDIAMFKCYKFLYEGADKCGNIANGDGPPNLKEYEGMWAMYKPWLGEGMHDVPFIHAFGNHDGEVAMSNSDACTTDGQMAAIARTKHFPNPNPITQSFYTGDDAPNSCIGGQARGSYYEFTWGDVQFWVLDVYQEVNRKPDGVGADDAQLWTNTLGAKQYKWFADTLKASTATFRFVVTHQLLGGQCDQALGATCSMGRGGAEVAHLAEWGGHGTGGDYQFDKIRTDRTAFPKPVHQLLRDHGVQLVLHGHDHVYMKQEKDGIIYQLGPQPFGARDLCNPSEKQQHGASYMSWDGTVCKTGGGHMRFVVKGSGAGTTKTVDVAMINQLDGSVEDSYTITADGSPAPPATPPPATAAATPSPATAAPSPSPSPSAGPRMVTITQSGGWDWTMMSDTPGVTSGSSFYPDVNLNVGDVVQFTGVVETSHQFAVKNGGGTDLVMTTKAKSDDLPFTLTWTVPAAGVYTYYCPPHEGKMRGTITATAVGAAGTGQTPAPAPAPSPAARPRPRPAPTPATHATAMPATVTSYTPFVGTYCDAVTQNAMCGSGKSTCAPFTPCRSNSIESVR